MKFFGIVTICAVFVRTGFAAGHPIDFSRDIRPILSENCFACHGPDQEQRKAKLRLDTKEGAFASRDGHPVILPGDAAGSELIKRLENTDPDDRMPPPKSGKKLSSAQIALFRDWIDQGAKWETHWAFTKPTRPPLPSVEETGWAKNEVDRFVLNRLEKEALTPQSEADKPTLLRRASLDLTGLPPSPEELDAFLADGSPEAYGKVVDRLMNTTRYGEHQARYWLDAVRYADSHGYHIDSTRSIWKYREWVIDAFNQNMPFDEFTIEQLAGDLLPDATLPQKIASGYIRCNMSTGEGGAIEEEYRAKYGFDRLETTSTVWLGLTMTCCRCHNHKYDPITQKEYYQLFSFFNSLDGPIMDGNQPNPAPFIKVPSRAQAERQEWLKESIAKAEQELQAPIPELDRTQPGWESDWHRRLTTDWTALDFTERSVTGGESLKSNEDRSLEVETADAKWQFAAELPAGELGGLKVEVQETTGPVRVGEIEAEILGADKPRRLSFDAAAASAEEKAARNALDGKLDTAWEFPNSTNSATAVFLLKEPVRVEKDSKLRVRFRFHGNSSAAGIRKFRISAATQPGLLAALFPVRIDPWRMIGPFPGEDNEAALKQVYPPEQALEFDRTYPGARDDIRWAEQPGYEDGRSHVFVQYLHGIHGVYYFHRTLTAAQPTTLEVSLRADDLARVWFNGEMIGERNRPWQIGDAPLTLKLPLKAGRNELLLKVVNHQGESRFQFDRTLDDPNALPTAVAAILAVQEHPQGDKGRQVRDHYREVNSPQWKATARALALWRDEQTAIERSIPTTLVARESEKPRETHLLHRGEYDKPGEEVSPSVPAILPPLPAGAPHNRLGLAEWLVNSENPLTARVIVNRMWQHFFGVGLVKTTEDFGMQSESPSNPQLLDWLATEFIRSGWNVKHMHRLIVTSATYRQRSSAPPEMFVKDPENRLLARGPRYRMDAETLRDTALKIGGLLVEEIGGSSVKPYQPPGLWEVISYNNSQKYEQDQDQEQYRRSVYIYWKRQAPPPNMLLFDAPTREYCVVRRPRTNTPLQALAMLNDPQFVEASRAFAGRILRECGPSDCDRLCYAFKLATSRQPAPDEEQVLADLLNAQRQEFASNHTAAHEYLQVGSWEPKTNIPEPELAAWTTVASTILNLDETISKN